MEEFVQARFNGARMSNVINRENSKTQYIGFYHDDTWYCLEKSIGLCLYKIDSFYVDLMEIDEILECMNEKMLLSDNQDYITISDIRLSCERMNHNLGTEYEIFTQYPEDYKKKIEKFKLLIC